MVIVSSNSEALEFFNRLTGKTADQINISNLSSAQRARFVSWCFEKGLSTELFENGTEVPVTQVKTNIPIVTSAKSDIVFDVAAGVAGVGVDIQDISELFPEDLGDFKSNERLLRIFTSKEIAYAEMKKNPKDTLAGIFSAKEAIFKASKLNHLESWADIEISHSDEGVPFHNEFSLSISHSNGMAVAVAFQTQSIKGLNPSADEVLKLRLDGLEKMLLQSAGFENNGNKNKRQVVSIIAISVILSACFTLALHKQIIPGW
jgi:phosphopantetheine--protein transferase-like protein